MRPSRLADPRNEIDLGIFSRVMLGAAAALALLAIVSPSAAAALIVNSLIAGSAATAVLRLVQGRLLGKGDTTASKPAAAAQQPLGGAAGRAERKGGRAANRLPRGT